MVVVQKSTVGEDVKSLWEQPVASTPLSKFIRDVAQTEKIILFGESNTGKTYFYLSILEYLKKKGMKREDLKMCIVFPDRPTGLTKLASVIPKEYLEGDEDAPIQIFTVNNYEDLVRATASAENCLQKHYEKTGKNGWLVVELLEDAWKSAQDYYCRQAYGQSMGEYFAQKRAQVKAAKNDEGAYKAFQGWGDWPVIKYFHNYNWIDRIKRMPYNVVFTAEVREEDSKDSLFSALGLRPAGEKDNLHRVDTILHCSHNENSFTIRPYKLTGYKKLYGKINITNKCGFEEHMSALDKLTKLGYRTSPILELEQEAGVKPPKKPKQTSTKKPKEKVEKEEEEEDEFDMEL